MVLYWYANRLDYLMGADAPIPPIMIGAAAPDGAPPRRFSKIKCHNALYKNHLTPPCLISSEIQQIEESLRILLTSHSCGIRRLGEALRRGALIINAII